ncbi:hypothetical protein I5M27_10835 [Adhaeribacter sp. BT258]|uniref:Lipoprotein n=1 Tax=Adhaeribacter terrigena TaxID=2793070 RepID=A0ABS1C255_9BACT|nr:hypothetical protein [Adhaeribacter terrigena]MBK0403482.1 hypothetical protein [Adhaeribacter terrigena]
MHTKLLLFAALTIAFSGCGSEEKSANKNAGNHRLKTTQTASGKMKARVENTIALDSIPSGSGLVRSGENFHLISDDSPYFFKLDAAFNVLEKNAIPRHQKTLDFRIPKSSKPDYESACLGKMNGETYLLAFASGSKSPERDSLLVVNLNDVKNAKTYSLRPFYELIKTQANLTDEDINVEGSAMIGETLYLFNRGKNVLVQTNWPKTLAFLTQKVAAPEIKTYRLKLPQIKGIDPGFSGACQLGNENKILFTASVENTKNWIEDGEILGSFIGIINVEKLTSQPLEKVALLTNKTGQTVIEKVESIEFLSREPDGTLKVFCLTDDDQGGSNILDINLQE